MLNVTERVAEMTFRVYYKLGPCLVRVVRNGEETRECRAFGILSGSKSGVKGGTARTEMTRTFILERRDRDWLPRRGDAISVLENGEYQDYVIASEIDEPAVKFWKGHRGFLRVIGLVKRR